MVPVGFVLLLLPPRILTFSCVPSLPIDHDKTCFFTFFANVTVGRFTAFHASALLSWSDWTWPPEPRGAAVTPDSETLAIQPTFGKILIIYFSLASRQAD